MNLLTDAATDRSPPMTFSAPHALCEWGMKPSPYTKQQTRPGMQRVPVAVAVNKATAAAQILVSMAVPPISRCRVLLRVPRPL
jgi:hypothetical protein